MNVPIIRTIELYTRTQAVWRLTY